MNLKVSSNVGNFLAGNRSSSVSRRTSLLHGDGPLSKEQSVNWSDGIATSNVCVYVGGEGVKLLERMTEGSMLGVVRITQQFLSNHHTIISIGITFCLYTRSKSCVTNIIAIIMVCYYVLSQRIIYIRFDFLYVKIFSPTRIQYFTMYKIF